MENSTIIVSWVIGLMNFEQTEIKFYYDHQTETFTKKFDKSVAFLSEKDVDQVLNQLDIEGLEKVKGTFEFPTEDLIEILTEVFVDFTKSNDKADQKQNAKECSFWN